MSYSDREEAIADRLEKDRGGNAIWGWITGAVVMVLMLIFLFGGSEEKKSTSATDLGFCNEKEVLSDLKYTLVTMTCRDGKKYIYNRPNK